MSGKDLIDSVRLSSRICRILGGQPPEGFNYELFLDENGEKISKSRGNGLTIDEWLRYAAPESLALYMFQQPRRAKRLYFDVIPRAVDDYLATLAAYPAQDPAQQLANPAWHIHAGTPPAADLPISFALLLNLAGAAHAESKDQLWRYIEKYAPGTTPAAHPLLDRLVGYALAYYADFVAPTRRFRAPDEAERAALAALAAALPGLPDDAEAIQNEVYEVGKRAGFANLRDWFKACYEVLLGQTQGPRMGSFIALYGRAETVALIEKALKGELVAEQAATA
jgi:lysyl-tRNA synthetase class 1